MNTLHRTIIHTIKRCAALGLLAGCILLAGCSTVSVYTKEYFGVAKYPPSDPRRIEVLVAEPSRAKTRLGEIFIDAESGASREKIEDKLRRAAAKFGADAVVIVSDQTRIFPVVHADWWSATVSHYPRRGVIGVAIKFQ